MLVPAFETFSRSRSEKLRDLLALLFTCPSPNRIAASRDAAPEVVLVVIPLVHLERHYVSLLRVDDEAAHNVVAVLCLRRFPVDPGDAEQKVLHRLQVLEPVALLDDVFGHPGGALHVGVRHDESLLRLGQIPGWQFNRIKKYQANKFSGKFLGQNFMQFLDMSE